MRRTGLTNPRNHICVYLYLCKHAKQNTIIDSHQNLDASLSTCPNHNYCYLGMLV